MEIKRPMLAETAKDTSSLVYPLIATPKVDGIRCLRLLGGVVTRSLKPIPNQHIRDVLDHVLPFGADGEITSGSNFQECTSAVMKRSGEPRFTFQMFDLIPGDDLEREYRHRLRDMMEWYGNHLDCHEFVTIVPPRVIWGPKELDSYEVEMLDLGYEGIMVRDPCGPYKQGRSTVREGWLLKIKRFVDAEAVIVGFIEMMHNDNEATINELGLTQRSTSKAGKRPAGTLGKFQCIDVKTGIEFNIGTGEGLTYAMRQEIWDNRSTYLHKYMKYKYQDIGVKVAPRIPIFVGFRPLADMDAEYRGKQEKHNSESYGCMAPVIGDSCINQQCSWPDFPEPRTTARRFEWR